MKRIFPHLLVLILLFSSPLGATIKVACVGDSITFGAKLIDRTQYRWPTQLQELLGDGYEVKDFGANSATLQDDGSWPYRERAVYRQSMEFQPDIVLLMLGTNDAKDKNWKGPDAFRSSLLVMIARYEKLPSKPRVILLTPTDVIRESFTIRRSHVQEEVPVILRLGHESLDLYTFTMGKKEWFQVDGIHPNRKGATAIAHHIEETLF